jgi:integrase/recombinase XerD
MATVSLYLDDRKKRGQLAKLKVRVYVNRDNIRHFDTKLSVTRRDFEASYGVERPAKKYKELKITIEAIKVKADNIVKKLGDSFTFEKFERQFDKKVYETTDVISYFKDYIKKLHREDRAGTASLYENSLNSLLAYKPTSTLPFNQITASYLNGYQKWFINDRGKSQTTLGMYLRNLRAIFNLAIKNGDISKEVYPFGKDKYKIPVGNNTKKAVINDVLKALYMLELSPGSSRKMARDFWFFSYQCNGMNFKDILSLKFKDVGTTSFSFIRQKTKNTTITKNRHPIMVPITAAVRQVFREYANIDRDPDNYVFPVFKKGMSEIDKLKASRNFIRFVNKNMAKLVKTLGLDVKINTMAARHSFTTAVTKKVGLEFAQEALGHTSLNTTQNYWAGFESEKKQEIADSLLNFD